MTGTVTHIDTHGGSIKAPGVSSIRFQLSQIRMGCRDRIAPGCEVRFAVLSDGWRDAIAVDVAPTVNPSNVDADRRRAIAKERDAKTVEKRAAKFGDAPTPSAAMADAFARTRP